MAGKKKFNITGLCIPQKHYMADISPKIDQIITQYIENEEYFTINRARQYGKTTILELLYQRQEFIIEIKIWRGEKYEEEGYEQLAGYLDARGVHRGYLLSFCDNKKSPREDRVLVTVHTRVNDISTDIVKKPELLDFIAYQAGRHNEDRETVALGTADCTARSLKQEPKRPVVNAECCYEGMLYQCSPALQRWIFWHSVLTGSAGWTYGANGMFTANHEKQLFGIPHYGLCWGEQTWQEAVHFEGSKHVGCCRKYLNQYEWWKLKPLTDVVEEPENTELYEETFAAEIGGHLIMAYMQKDVIKLRKAGLPWLIQFKNLRAGTKYQIKAYNPIRDYETKLGEAVVDDDGRLATPTLPVFQDWLVVLEQI